MTRVVKLLMLWVLIIPFGLRAENLAVTKMLKEQYGNASILNFPDGSQLKGEYYMIANFENGKVKTGFCDVKGNVWFEPKYDYGVYSYDTWLLTEGDKVYIYSPDRKLLNTVNGYKRVLSYDPKNRLIVVSKETDGTGTGVIDLDGNIVVPPDYNYISNKVIQKYSFDKPYPLLMLTKKEGDIQKKGVADLKGHILLEPVYDDISIDTWNGNAELRLKKGGKEGRASIDGKLLVAADKYDKVSFAFQDGSRSVYRNNLKSMIDQQGNELVPFMFEGISDSDVINHYDYIQVENGGKKGYMTAEGKVVLAPEYDKTLAPIINGKQREFLVAQGQYAGAFALDGTPLVPVKYNMIQPCGYGASAGSFLVGVNYSASIPNGILTLWDIPAGTLWGFYDKNGKEILKPEYSFVGAYDDLILVNRGGKCGPLTSVLNIKDVTGGQWGYYDLDGNEVIPVEYDALSPFANGVANGVKDGVASVIPHPKKGTTLKILNGGATAFNSPVDKEIPESGKKDNELFAFIFSTENYTNYEGADYALRDGEILRQYCEKTLGAPEKNVRVFADATYGNIKSNLKKIAEIADVYDGDAKFIVYFSGLGITDDATGTPYLLGADAVPGAIPQTAIDLTALAAELEQIPAKWILLVADAPFNGMNRLGKPLGEGRGVRLKAKQPEPKGAVIICTASSDGGNAGVDANTGHGLLTLALLENLRSQSSPTLITERLDAVTNRVKRISVEAGSDVQTPSVTMGRHPSVSTAKY